MLISYSSVISAKNGKHFISRSSETSKQCKLKTYTPKSLLSKKLNLKQHDQKHDQKHKQIKTNPLTKQKQIPVIFVVKVGEKIVVTVVILEVLEALKDVIEETLEDMIEKDNMVKVDVQDTEVFKLLIMENAADVVILSIFR